MAEEVLDNPVAAPAPVAPAAPPPGPAPTPEPAAVTPSWPDDWRAKLANGDEPTLRRLERFSAPTEVWRSFRALEQKMSSGEVKAALPDNPSPEMLGQWRKDNGIPDTPEGYEIKDLGLSAADPIPGALAKFAHEKNWTPAQLKDALTFRKGEVERLSKANADADAADRQKTEDIYRAEWGNDYRLNTGLVQGLMDATATSDGMKADLLETMKINPEIGRWLVQMARVYNPVATVLPSGSANIASQVEDRMAEIAKLMGNRTSEYWKGPTSAKLQEEYRNLAGARDRFK